MSDMRRRAKASPEPDGGSPWAARRRRPRDHEVKREAVIRAAARAFNERGFHHTSLDDIAADLGVTKPTVYYYVAKQGTTAVRVFLAGLKPIRAALREADRLEGTGRNRLDAVIRGYATAIASEYGWCMVRAHDQDLGVDMRRQINALKSEIDQGIRRLLRAGMDDGSIAPCDPKITAFALAGRSTGSPTGTGPTRCCRQPRSPTRSSGSSSAACSRGPDLNESHLALQK